MNELQAIVDAYTQSQVRGERTALATVVNVVGSAYRRPGARMLIAESGLTVGTISGGCLERDVVERAAEVIKSGVARIVEYDTRGNEDIVWGLGLGCNGVVQILLESVHEESEGAKALQFIAGCLHARQRGILATVISVTRTLNDKSDVRRIGERLLLDSELNICDQTFTNDNLAALICADAREAFASGRAMLRAYETSAGRVEIFFDIISPPRSLIIFGAEPDAVPVARQALTLGWHVTVVDTRARQATLERFREADDVLLCRAEDIAARISLMPNTAAIVMTHNYMDDIALLRALLPSPVNYLGILGPKQRTAKVLEEIGAEGIGLAPAQLARLHSPIGMDIGAETPEEIALAIIAEIKAVGTKRGGGFLRDRNAPIHGDTAAHLTMIEVSIEPRYTTRESASAIVCRS